MSVVCLLRVGVCVFVCVWSSGLGPSEREEHVPHVADNLTKDPLLAAPARSQPRNFGLWAPVLLRDSTWMCAAGVGL